MPDDSSRLPRGPAPRLDLMVGVDDESLLVATFFDQFDWDGGLLDADQASAEDLLGALGD